MTILVGIDTGEAELGALALGALLAASAGEGLVVATVTPAAWQPAGAHVDADYRDYLAAVAKETLERAGVAAPAGVSARFIGVEARSASSGLVRAARDVGARLIVTGSADDGFYGRISLGSVTSRLLHSSPLPVALAVRGELVEPDARVGRVSVAYGGRRDDEVVARASREAAALGAELRLVSFAVRPRTSFVTAVSPVDENQVVDAWSESVAAEGRRALEEAGIPGAPVEIARGQDWRGAVGSIRWQPHELLALGSSPGMLEHVFLGSRATKILRHAPVPTLVLPRGEGGR